MTSIDLGKLVHAAVHQMNENSEEKEVSESFWRKKEPEVTGVQKIINRGQEMASKAKDLASENPGIAGGAAAAAGLLGAGLAARKYMGRKKA